jgi:rfaE bifunctional protein nucleotidyltransferase chain/domain
MMKEIEKINKKILCGDDLDKELSILRQENKKIVFTNGCFDILHLGHVDYLSKAKDLGDCLIVGINSDSSVRRLKGKTRPIQDEESRKKIMASLSFVDFVVMFNEDTPYNLIKKVQPDVLVKGADYKKEDIVGYDIVKQKGGKVETINYLEGFSTSNIIKKIKEEE